MIEVRGLTPGEVTSRLAEIAALRCVVFREWPYLYDGNLEYERAYLSPYCNDVRALIIAVLHNGRLVGMSTGMPLEMQSDQIVAPFLKRPESPSSILYGGESVLLSPYRGRGIGHTLFDQREAWARTLARQHIAFCSVIRPANHPARPAQEGHLDHFWTARGYAPVLGAVAEMSWRDLGDTEDTTKRLQFWMNTLS